MISVRALFLFVLVQNIVLLNDLKACFVCLLLWCVPTILLIFPA
jgi:hypothetical protein